MASNEAFGMDRKSNVVSNSVVVSLIHYSNGVVGELKVTRFFDCKQGTK